MLNFLRKLCGTQTQKTIEGEGSCNQTGHDYSEKFSEDIYSRPKVGRADIEIYRDIYWKCTKCGSLEDEEETVAKIRVTDDGEIEEV